MTESENLLLTRVGPGTPMGKLLRQYWIPLLHSSELPDKDGAPLRMRLLGENLIAFRNTAGKVGLLDQACPHRCASLFFGRNEENGLRCLYHGWKFDIAGRCVDVPNEPADSKFHEQIRATAYPCVEKSGLIWTYLGPDRQNPPPLPELGWAMVGPNRRGALCYQRECNWLQAMEGDFDSSHLSFLHLKFDAKHQSANEKKPGIEYYRNLARMDKQPLLEVRETDAGVMYGARRAADAGQFYWRVTQFLMPFYTSVPSYGGKNRDKVWVPIDDEHTMVWEPHWSSTRDLTEEEQKGWNGRVATSGFLPDNGDWLGRGRFAANAANDYLHSRARQRTSNFSGFEDVTPIQDAAMQESMGAICDRTREHLGASDAAIVHLRRRLLNAANALAKDQKPPPEIENPGWYRQHGDQMLLNASDSWVEHYTEKMKADYASL